MVLSGRRISGRPRATCRERSSALSSRHRRHRITTDADHAADGSKHPKTPWGRGASFFPPLTPKFWRCAIESSNRNLKTLLFFFQVFGKSPERPINPSPLPFVLCQYIGPLYFLWLSAHCRIFHRSRRRRDCLGGHRADILCHRKCQTRCSSAGRL
jgi:hypothetical protein